MNNELTRDRNSEAIIYITESLPTARRCRPHLLICVGI